MFRFAVRVTVVTSSRKNDEYTSQRSQYLDAFNKANAIDLANAINRASDIHFEREYTQHRTAEPVAISERRNGNKLERSVFTFEELDRICEEWTAPGSTEYAA